MVRGTTSSTGSPRKSLPKPGCCALAALCVLTSGWTADARAKFTIFDVPGSLGTNSIGINRHGDVAGYYWGSGGEWHGFLRTTDGTITSFDPPGSTDTWPRAINNSGVIAGNYHAILWRGFVRTADGTITGFDPAGSIETMVTAINSKGIIAGYYVDASQNTHGFVRFADGRIRAFDAGWYGTYPSAINNKRMIAGCYDDVWGSSHGFLRDTNGKFTKFDVVGAGFTCPVGINNKGEIAGYASGLGFQRSPDGTMTTFNAAWNTWPSAINSDGEITGSFFYTRKEASHAFVRAPDGTITKFAPPGSVNVFPSAINEKGAITGYFYDLNHVVHGFLRNR